MTPSVLDYWSDVPTYALAFSPLSTTSSLKLAVGSFVEGPVARPIKTESGASSVSPPGANSNHLTVISLLPHFTDLEDDYADSSSSSSIDEKLTDGYARNRRGERVPTTGGAFAAEARAPHPYPPSALAFSPPKATQQMQSSVGGAVGDGTREMVASSAECLRLWDLVSDDAGASGGFVGQGRGTQGSRLVQRAMLANSKADYSAPLTSFSWSALEPTHIVTSSIDTTCTVWDIATGVPITQLIAHDREVYDVQWAPSNPQVFASVGADGSVRMFDLRSLEHSTILYEATGPAPASGGKKENGHSPTTSTKTAAAPPSPLLRLAFSPTSPTYLSVCHADAADVQILDTRSPGTPVMEVRGHGACVNGMAWGGQTMAGATGGETSGPGWLATCSDDSTLLLWDLSTTVPTPGASRSQPQTPKVIRDPVLAYTAPSEINAVAWGGGGDWVAAGCGKLVRCLRV